MTRAEAERRVIAAAHHLVEEGKRLYGETVYRTIELQETLTALDALPDTGEADGWRPIEKAPLDNNPILLFTTCHGQVEAWFKPGEWHDYLEGREYNGPLWVCADDAFYIEIEETPEGLLHGTATHFRPLPAPPNPGEG